MTRNDRHVHHHHGHLAPPPVEYRHQESSKKISSTFLIILVSLLFLAVFGGALVGGVVSGDPSNRFFITIIAASGVAIAIAAIVSLRYCCLQRAAKRQRENNVIKPHNSQNLHHNNRDVRQTFTQSADEDEEVGYYDSQGYFFQGQGPVQETIHEVKARTMLPGDISAMSPGSYGFDSFTQASSPAFGRGTYKGHGYRVRQHGRSHDDYREGSFDFASIVSSKPGLPAREDPPEDGIGPSLYTTGSMGRDPSAAKVTADGNILADEDSDVDLNSPDAKSQSSRSVISRYDVPDEDEEDVKTSNKRREAEEEVPQEPSKSSSQRRHKDTFVPPPPPPPPPPRSGRSTPSSRAGSSTPAGSEAGSTVSSLFLKPLANMFAKKKPASEAGYSDVSATVKALEAGESKTSESDKKPIVREGKPPMPGKKTTEDKRKGLDTIGGGGGSGSGSNEDRYAPSTPGKNSTFSIPPPRRVPSTPGSEAPSEFRSMAGSSVFSNGVASSTFDPGARERALQRTQRNTAALGATFNDMPVFYEEDESVVNSVAPSEPTARSVGYDVLAPPGPLGMVVDTVEKGCVVHSLKKTSPMQGLINPGDLIVALDDLDVRKMDAASLTKLMAKKSQQKERKFTLIPADQY